MQQTYHTVQELNEQRLSDHYVDVWIKMEDSDSLVLTFRMMLLSRVFDSKMLTEQPTGQKAGHKVAWVTMVTWTNVQNPKRYQTVIKPLGAKTTNSSSGSGPKAQKAASDLNFRQFPERFWRFWRFRTQMSESVAPDIFRNLDAMSRLLLLYRLRPSPVPHMFLLLWTSRTRQPAAPQDKDELRKISRPNFMEVLSNLSEWTEDVFGTWWSKLELHRNH